MVTVALHLVVVVTTPEKCWAAEIPYLVDVASLASSTRGGP